MNAGAVAEVLSRGARYLNIRKGLVLSIWQWFDIRFRIHTGPFQSHSSGYTVSGYTVSPELVEGRVTRIR